MALLSPDQLAGVNEKLKRADENIQNLQSEISGFFHGCKYPALPKLNDKKILEALEYHRDLAIPPRFGVLAGEVIHHLRSCLDHIVWEMSDDSYRLSRDSKHIAFPILDTRPSLKDKFARYDRKIQGVRNVGAINLIEQLQPYHRVDPINSPLSIIHNMDITDKHKELVLINSNAVTEGLSGPLAMEFMRHLRAAGGPRQLSSELKRELDQHTKTTLQISFREFGGRKIQAVVPGLVQLTGYVRGVVERFRALP